MRGITTADRQRAADILGVSEDHVQAVLAIEARGSGFIRNTNMPVILFEGHHFYKHTGGRYGESDISYRKWTKAHYKGGSGEYERLLRAFALDETAALLSASWGLGQIMGSNHHAAGFATVQEFVNAAATSERHQLMQFTRFIEHHPAMVEALQGGNWAGFARRYNGPAYAKNKYDVKLRNAFRGFRSENPERDQMRDVQAALNVTMNAGLAVDGWDGPKTQDAISAFQRANDMPANGLVSGELLAALGVS